MINFHFCNAFNKTLQKNSQNIQENVKRKILEYSYREELINIGNIKFIPASQLYVLRLHNPESRIIIQECDVEIEDIKVKVFFVRDIIANVEFDREYGRLLYGKIIRGYWIADNPLLDDDIDNFRNYYNNENLIKQNVKLLDPPASMVEWFNGFRLTLDNEVFETEDWVAYALENCIKTGMIDKYIYTLRIIIEKIIAFSSNEYFTQIKNESNIEIFKYEEHNFGILFSKIKLNNKEYVILFNAAHTINQEEYWKRSIEKILHSSFTIKDLEDLNKFSFRSYPKWTLKHDEIWFRIEKSEENNNLSLTNEQINFLKNFKFPCYINGRAGSGKSTLLYYIFANTIYFKDSGEIEGNIIFLTENQQLLKETKTSVFNLLENNPEFGLEVTSLEQYNECFNSFKHFLLNLLDEDDLKNFEDEKYLHFPLFKIFYENSTIKQNIKNEYSAEEAWFVISTYIYGYDIVNKINSNTYENIPNKSQQIEINRFKEIEKHILPFYEGLLEKGYWDKLTIIRYINNNINLKYKQKYDVIVCDEAQDFCRVELDFILKQSKYLDYNLSSVSEIPIIFAGDSNQTVNPTGFRDEIMTSLLFEVLENLKFKNTQESKVYSPDLNYRSIEHVVNLANFIQYYRMKHLGISQKSFQESKRPNQNINDHFNIFLDYDKIKENKLLETDILEKLKYKIFIIPVNSEEKGDYKNGSEFLSIFDELEIKTSVEAKGAEYKHVVLYGFGEYFLKYFDNLEDNEQQFQKMYYFNKLYVAITRAKSELIIIDSKESKLKFWEQLVNKVSIVNQNIWGKLENIKTKIIIYNPDSINTIIPSTKEDALENAKKDMKLGIDHENPARLKVAASQFFRLGKDVEGNRCLGLAEELNHNYITAANYYKKINDLVNASNVFFKGFYFEQLKEIGNNLQNTEHQISLIIVAIMNHEFVAFKEMEYLSINNKKLSTMLYSLKWRDEFIHEATIFLTKNEDRIISSMFIDVLHNISKTNDDKLFKNLASKSFELEDYKNAVKYWEYIDFFNIENYYIAKLKCFEKDKDDENIIIYKKELIKFNEPHKQKLIFKEIIDLYKLHDYNNFGSEYHLVIYLSYIMMGNITSLSKFKDILDSKVSHYELDFFYGETLQNYSLTKEIVVYIIKQWCILLSSNYESFMQDVNYLDRLNNIYYKQSQKYNIPYKAYSKEEIKNFNSILNENINSQESSLNHFKNFSFRNFRQFKYLKLENIGQFNLIVGDNNVGKTSLLEALLFTNDVDLYFNNLAFAYIARNNCNLVRKEAQELKYEVTYDFLNDFFNKENIDADIEYEIEENRNKWKFILQKPSLDTIRKHLNIASGINEKEFISLIQDDEKWTFRETPLIIRKINHDDLIKTQFIPFGKGYDTTLAKSYYDYIDKHRKIRNDFLEYMRIFIPNIDRITVDTESGRIDIEEKSHENPSPLHQYGEGANKLFRILVQITLQKDKKLLIDEIDAGIHYSHFIDFWSVILEVANQNNVQIFATTHNLECIQYFKTILKNKESKIRSLSKVITLRKLEEDIIKAYTYKFEEFEFELDNDFEIRGGIL